MARNIAPQDLSWFLDLVGRDRLDLSPPYQRRSVWTPKERRFFLDTIFSGYPCPPLFLHKSLSDEGIATYHVVDGKQRLETVIRYANNKIAVPLDYPDPSLAGKKFSQLTVTQKKRFWNYQFAVEMLDDVNNASVNEIFDRYNRTSKNLQRQELRHARYDGWFVTFAEEEAKKDEWRRLGIVTTAQARRMRDVQFLSELMVLILANAVNGFDQDQLDTYYADYDIPEEVKPDFVEDDFITAFERAKSWILEVEAINKVVSNQMKSATHFYSLWAAVALCAYSLPSPALAAERLLTFMMSVDAAVKADSLEAMPSSTDIHARNVFAYAQNSRGASTEHPQRVARFQALTGVIFDLPSAADEDPAVT